MNAKKLLLATALLGSLSAGMAAGAEITYDVFDRKNNEELTKQTAKIDATLKALTGNRNMGKEQGNIDRHALPPDFIEQFNQMRKSLATSTLAGSKQMVEAQRIAKEAEIFGCAKRLKDKVKYKEEMMAACTAIELAAPLALATLNEANGKVQKRMDNIQALMTLIDKDNDPNSPPDLKRSADLSARIQAEMVMLQNEKMLVDIAMQTHAQQLTLSRDYYMQWKSKEVQEKLVERPKDGTSIFGN
ncbi:hypothetical protein HSX11_09335 [Oxalobacteraceae bacterium]|nr:hypothetical protein [Oxalobacteraceae bacterium]